MKLKNGEAVILTDIKRKKNTYLDFVIESTLIKLDEDPILKTRLENLLPAEEVRKSPRNVK